MSRALTTSSEDASQAARQASELAQRLLSLARPSAVREQLVDLSSIVEDMAQLLRRTLPRTIDVELRVARGLTVRGNEADLRQLLMNVCVNARDAMPRGGHLTITARAARRTLDDRRAKSTEDNVVVIEVSDDGMGMPEDVRQRAFEPFFTTKRPGSGSGLGLPLVYNIVRNLGGEVELESTPGRGTTVRA